MNKQTMVSGSDDCIINNVSSPSCLLDANRSIIYHTRQHSLVRNDN